MSAPLPVYFGPFRMDPSTLVLHRGDEVVPLKPRAAELLLYMARNPGRVLGKEELLREVWRGTHVTSGVLKVHVHQIRQALGGSGGIADYVETVGREGYRFVADSEARDSSGRGTLVGREAESAHLKRAFTRATEGKRTLVMVEGEPGIGKTALVDALVADLSTAPTVWCARGQCIEHYGESEAYLPIFAAIEDLARDDERRPAVLETLRRAAPSWLVQLPSLIGPDSDAELRDRADGASPDRMPREIATALAELSEFTTLVLVLEDLHWSDVPTVDLLSYLAQAREPARLLVVCTYRPADVIVSGHPIRQLRQELVGKRQCETVALEPLSEVAIRTYLERRFPRSAVATDLAPQLHRWTDGNALFVNALVDDLVRRGRITSTSDGWAIDPDAEEMPLPSSLRDFIHKQVEAHDEPLRRMLEVASVVGSPFPSGAVATALEAPVDEIEDNLDDLVQAGRILRDAGVQTGPSEGEVCAAYAFRHTLFPNVVYGSLPPARRRRLHAKVGRWLKDRYGARAGEHGAELARHFECAGMEALAATHYREAAETAIHRSANQLGIDLADRSLACLRHLPDNEPRQAEELALELLRGSALAATRGIAAPEVEAAYARARALSRQVDRPEAVLPSLVGLGYFHLARLELTAASEIAPEMVASLDAAPDPAVAPLACFFLTELALARGDNDGLVHWLGETKRRLSDNHGRFDALSTWLDPKVTSAIYEAALVWAGGSPSHATTITDQAIADARALGHTYSLAYALSVGSVLAIELRDETRASAWANEAIRLSEEGRFDFLRARAEVPAGWAQVMDGEAEAGVSRIRQGLEALNRVGVRFSTGQALAALAHSFLIAGDPSSAEDVAREGVRLCEATGERTSYPEAMRLVGSSLWARAARSKRTTRLREQAERALTTALEAARERQIRCVVLRAATDLAKLMSESDRTAEAIALLNSSLDGMDGERGNADVDAAWALREHLRM